VVQPDPRESDLTPASDTERNAVKQLVPMTYTNDLAQLTQALAETTERQELWWVGFLCLLALLCGEVWMTRRVAMNR
jgi:hypothetical protein